jgi:hypothetical protein
LYLAKAKDDWNKGTLTIDKGSNKIVLPMYLTNYQGETQEEESEFTLGNSYENSESTNLVNRDHFKPIGMGEYFQSLTMVDDSDNAIFAWQNSPVLNITTEIESEQEPPYETDSEELQENISHTYLPDFKATKSDGIDMNLGTNEEPKNIKVFKGLIPEMVKEWLEFFRDTQDVFTWTYKDLRGVPPKICQHKIVLEPNAKSICQRQYSMNPKYSLMVKKEIDKLLKCGFIYPIPYSEWVSPTVV